jgi:SAM-dependent methyltransferase
MQRLIRWLKWKRALSAELHFWDEWLATKGGEWPDDYHRRLDGQAELQSNLKGYLAYVPDGGEVSILDVGSGPITRLGYRWTGRVVTITAVDALADEYQALLDKHRIVPPLRTVACSAESLTNRFPGGSFDLAYCRNALDHCYSPVKAIRQMLHVVRGSGLVVLEHYANEAETTGYYGLHQWNFDVLEGRLKVWNHHARCDIAAAVADLAEVSWERKSIGREWIIALLKKHASPPEAQTLLRP